MKGTKTRRVLPQGKARGLQQHGAKRVYFSHREVFSFGETVEGPVGLRPGAVPMTEAAENRARSGQAGERLSTGRPRRVGLPTWGPAPDLLSSAEGEN